MSPSLSGLPGLAQWFGWAVSWLALWAVLVFASQNNHPNFTLNALASGILVVGALVLSRIGHRPWYRVAVGLVVLGGIAAALIHLGYDHLWGPDANRFSPGLNWFLDSVSVGLLALTQKGMAWLGKWCFGNEGKN